MRSVLRRLIRLFSVSGSGSAGNDVLRESEMRDLKPNQGEPVLDANTKTTSAASATVTVQQSYFRSLAPETYDEMMAGDGSVRAQYAPVARFIEQIGAEGCAARFERLQRRIVENGLTLDSFSDPSNVEQPWQLDLNDVVVFIFPDVHRRSPNAVLMIPEKVVKHSVPVEKIHCPWSVFDNAHFQASLRFFFAFTHNNA